MCTDSAECITRIYLQTIRYTGTELNRHAGRHAYIITSRTRERQRERDERARSRARAREITMRQMKGGLIFKAQVLENRLDKTMIKYNEAGHRGGIVW